VVIQNLIDGWRLIRADKSSQSSSDAPRFFGVKANLPNRRSLNRNEENMSAVFVDHYELLELSSNANSETIERVFRYLANKHHPDVVKDGSSEDFFKQILEAYETLHDPEKRAAYDVQWQAQKVANAKVVQGANSAEDDCQDRIMILQIFYGQRRQDMRNPGVSVGRIEDMIGCPPEVLSFHLWFFREKGWIDREESGVMSITALGVEHLESVYLKPDLGALPRLTHDAASAAPGLVPA
jgi:hypothetical protein